MIEKGEVETKWRKLVLSPFFIVFCVILGIYFAVWPIFKMGKLAAGEGECGA